MDDKKDVPALLAEQIQKDATLSWVQPRLNTELLSKLQVIGSGLAPLLKINEELLSRLGPASQLPHLGKAIEKVHRSWQLPLAVNAFSTALGVAAKLPKIPHIDFPKLALPAINLPKIDWATLHQRDERALRFAANHNWFIQPETFYTFTAEIDECRESPAQLNQLFIDMMKENEDEIRIRLIQDHPLHAAMLEEMFRLHREKRYLASIPLALICAEGIAYRVAEKSIFNHKKNRPEIAEWLDKQSLSTLAKAFLASLSERYPMSKSRQGALSRHRVLHGIDTDYGTEQFSLQVISLLGFVGWAFATDGLAKETSEHE